MFTFLFKHKPSGRLVHVLAEDINNGAETAAMIIEGKGIHEIPQEIVDSFKAISTLSHEVGADAIEVDLAKIGADS